VAIAFQVFVLTINFIFINISAFYQIKKTVFKAVTSFSGLPLKTSAITAHLHP